LFTYLVENIIALFDDITGLCVVCCVW